MTDGQPATSNTKPNTEYNNKEYDKQDHEIIYTITWTKTAK